MGGFVDSFFGTGGEGRRAADAEIAASRQAIDELRRQFGITQENIEPFLQAGTEQLPALSEGATTGGLENRLAEILGGDAFTSLREERERSTRGQLSAGGLTRSGTALQEIANVPTSLAFAIEEALTGRSQNLAAGGQNAALGLGSLGAQTSTGIANFLAGQGRSQASGILTDAQARAQGVGNIFSAAQLGLAAFSDPRLKKNVEKISEIHNLDVFQWDWIEGARGTIIELFPTIGFMATDVEEKYPCHVRGYCGFMVIDYPALLDQLAAA